MVPPIDWTIENAEAFAVGYLCGSIPFGVIITKLAGAPDVRSIGSGNIGATNVLRTGRKGLAAATLLCDMLKGTVAVVVALSLYDQQAAMLAATGAFLGHLFPVWLRFKGGKGVAIFVGLLLGFGLWIALGAFAALWLATAALTRYSSLAALIASAATPAVLFARGDDSLAKLFLLLAVLLWLMHRANIVRLIRGGESKIGSEAKSSGGS